MSNSGENASAAGVGKRARLHFAIAAAVLLVAGAGWHSIMAVLHWTMDKKPVPWPATIQPEDVVDHRLTSFPDKLGKPDQQGQQWRYVLAEDGELSRNGQRDGAPDGIIEIRDEDLKSMGTKAHRLNWYYSGLYRDTRAEGVGGGGRRYVQMHVTYYTGLLDAVPHVPERCLGAGGARVVPGQSRTVPVSVPSAPPPWQNFAMYRTTYEDPKRRIKTAQYHFFSMNGQPTAHWESVRGKLTLPWVRYCYFAKVQIAAFTIESNRLGTESDLSKCDQVCNDFLTCALPEILRFLPSPEALKELEASGG